MRTLLEVDSEIENTKRTMANMVIHQSDLDHELAILDRRLGYLEIERANIIEAGRH